MKNDIIKNEHVINEICYVIEGFTHKKETPWSKGRKNDGFIFILDGTCEYTFQDGYKFFVSPGNVLYLAYKSIYKMNVTSDIYKYIYCDFMFNSDNLRRSDVYKVKNNDEIENLFYKLKSAIASESNAKSMEFLYRIYNELIINSNPNYIGSSSKQLMQNAQKYIKENISSQNICVSKLAEVCNISETYFRTLFSKHFNISPAKYINNLRIQTAKKLMEQDFLTFEEIAYQCGFSTVQYFFRVFKKTTGYTPSEYIKNFIL